MIAILVRRSVILKIGWTAAIAGAILGAALLFAGPDSVGAAADGPEEVRLPILMYHEIKNLKLGKDVISPYEFESDLIYLRDHGYHTVTMSELIGYVHGRETLPEKPIVLSFDDGYLNTYKYALPLLKKYNMKIVFSIIGKNTDDFTEIADGSLDYSHVTWAQLNEMLDSGCVEVQNHTYNLHSTVKGRIGCMRRYSETEEAYRRVLSEDICRLQTEILENTGAQPTTFVYPYGKSSEHTEEILRKLGFQATLTCDYGVNLISANPEELFGLKRICRAHGDTLGKLLKEAEKTVKQKTAAS